MKTNAAAGPQPDAKLDRSAAASVPAASIGARVGNESLQHLLRTRLSLQPQLTTSPIEDFGRELDAHGLSTTQDRVAYLVKKYPIADPSFMLDLIPLEESLQAKYKAGHDYGFFGRTFSGALATAAETAAQMLNWDAAFYIGACHGRRDRLQVEARSHATAERPSTMGVNTQRSLDYHEELAANLQTAFQVGLCVTDPLVCVGVLAATQATQLALERAGVDPKTAELVAFGVGLVISMGGLRLPRLGRTPGGFRGMSGGAGGGGGGGAGGGGGGKVPFEPFVGEEVTEVDVIPEGARNHNMKTSELRPQTGGEIEVEHKLTLDEVLEQLEQEFSEEPTPPMGTRRK